jgi:DNA-binding transcriptional LysR family regulator
VRQAPGSQKCVFLQLEAAKLQPGMDWDDLRVFLAVARRASHKGAARQLGIDPTTVGRRIAALERALAAKLFTRTPDALEVTLAGHRLLERAARIEVELLAAEREVSATDQRVEGTLRVTTGDGLLHYLLVPLLTELRRACPLLALELRGETRLLDLSRREADVAIRFGRPTQPSLLARRLGHVGFGLYASEQYLELRGNPRNLAALAAHDFIGFDAALDQVEQVRWMRRAVPEPRYVLRCNGTTTQALACAEGHGIALLPDYVGARQPRLRRLLPKLLGPKRELWFVTHQDLHHNARVVAFQRFAAAALSGEALRG